MTRRFAFPILLLCTACGQDDTRAATSTAEAGEVAEAASPAAAPTPFAKGRFAPRDECDRLDGAAEFRNRLAEATRLRDEDAVAALAADDVHLDFGGGAGADELKSRLNDPERGLWLALDQLLTLGCAANDEGGITLPWVWDQDIGDADAYAALLVLGEDEPVRASASRSGEEIATVSWDLVEAVSYNPEQAFQQVKLADGRTGFIATDKVRSVIDYRLLAERRDGRWRITTFIAGD